MTMWRKTLEYLGLVEETEEYHELPERPHDDGRAVRPAMHDTTGPIEVVRPDGGGRTSDVHTDLHEDDMDPRLRPVQDLTEPVSVVDGESHDRQSRAGSHGRDVRDDRDDRDRGRDTRRGGQRRAAEAGGSRRRGDGAGADGNVRQLRPEAAGMPGGLGRRVAIVAVADYEGGAREVGQRYRQSVPVVFDLTDAPTDDRRRVLDFVAGITFALHGEMVKVGPRSFLIVPEGGEVADAEWDRLATLGYRP